MPLVLDKGSRSLYNLSTISNSYVSKLLFATPALLRHGPECNHDCNLIAAPPRYHRNCWSVPRAVRFEKRNVSSRACWRLWYWCLPGDELDDDFDEDEDDELDDDEGYYDED